jgi:glycerol-1-phosphate dehydrogenase [NAD(P)+]
MSSPYLGTPCVVVEASAVEYLREYGAPLWIVANDPPWTAIANELSGLDHTPVDIAGVTMAWDMELAHLVATTLEISDSLDLDRLAQITVVGIGGGTALDTAKFLAAQLNRPLIQIPTITSVDAGFTDAIGVRHQGRVRYIGRVRPECVVIDLGLIRSAPQRLNRAGIGDVLSCHTGLWDWHLAAAHGDGPPLNDDLVNLGSTLLNELELVVDEVAAVSDAGIRFLVDAYRRIGAACAAAGHSRFEEGSEHFWAYAWEHRTGGHLVHGELIACAVVALAHLQGNDPQRAADIVRRSQVRAHPEDLGIEREDFEACLLGLSTYARAEGLEMSVVDYHEVHPAAVNAA